MEAWWLTTVNNTMLKDRCQEPSPHTKKKKKKMATMGGDGDINYLDRSSNFTMYLYIKILSCYTS